MGVRDYKIIDIAVFDVVATLIFGLMIFFLFEKLKPNNKRCKISLFLVITLFLFTFGILMHLIFNIDSKLGFYLGLNSDPRPS